MSDKPICTELGCMTPAQVVQCAEGSQQECWVSAKLIGDDGTETTYECCGGGGKKARFSLFKKGAKVHNVEIADVPSSLTWVRRSMV
jgi:hypothetical protein